MKKQKSKQRKRRHTAATKKKPFVMSADSMTQSHLEGQAFEEHTLRGLGKKKKGLGSF